MTYIEEREAEEAQNYQDETAAWIVSPEADEELPESWLVGLNRLAEMENETVA
jgi:hypothetical protein